MLSSFYYYLDTNGDLSSSFNGSFCLSYQCANILLVLLLYDSLSTWTDSSSGWSVTSNAFIFSLINKEGLAPFKSMVKRPSSAIYRGSSYGPLFGMGNDIRIADNANSNTNSYTSFGYSYSVPSGVKDRYTILAGTQKFSPDEVEVFYRNWITWNIDQSSSLVIYGNKQIRKGVFTLRYRTSIWFFRFILSIDSD